MSKIGYKTALVCELLGVGRQTLRYWREKLDPRPDRIVFSAGDLLAYQVIRVAVHEKGMSVSFLSQFDWGLVFKAFNQDEATEFEAWVLLIDTEQLTLTFQSNDQHANTAAEHERTNLSLNSIPLSPVIRRHSVSFLRLGNDDALKLMVS